MKRFAIVLIVGALAGACDDDASSSPTTFAPTTASASNGSDDTGAPDSTDTDAASTSTSSHASGSSSGDVDLTTGAPPPPDCDAGLTACGVTCVDLQTDLSNCGDCGISCVASNAEAMCTAGQCSVGACEPGWSDCDGLPGNGCEAATECTAGTPCTTACGSQGITSCNACDPVCDAPAEVCNAVDDDCNGQCDEGIAAGCRRSVHRSNGPNGHYYTNVLAETSQEGRSLEFQDYWWMYAAETAGLEALYRCDLGDGRFFLTASEACEGAGNIDATLGYMAPSQTCGATALHRLRSPAGRHFYTVSAAERDSAVANLNFVSEGISGYVWTSEL